MGKSFSEETIANSSVRDRTFIACDFSRTRIQDGASFENCHFIACSFVWAIIEGAKFMDCRFHGCEMLQSSWRSGATNARFSFCNFYEAEIAAQAGFHPLSTEGSGFLSAKFEEGCVIPAGCREMVVEAMGQASEDPSWQSFCGLILRRRGICWEGLLLEAYATLKPELLSHVRQHLKKYPNLDTMIGKYIP